MPLLGSARATTAPMPHQPSSVMSLGDHLDELRRRLFLALAAPVPLAMLLFAWSDTLLRWVLDPAVNAFEAAGVPARLQVLAPPEMVLTKLKLSLIFALVFSAPWVFYQVWMFVAPGLYKHERRFVHVLIPGSAILTVAGVMLLQFVMLPLMLQVLMTFAVSFEFPERERFDPAVSAIFTEMEAIPVRAAPPTDPQVGDAWLLVPEMKLFLAHPVAAEVAATDGTDGTEAAGAGGATDALSGVESTEAAPVEAASVDGGVTPADAAVDGAASSENAAVEVREVTLRIAPGIDQPFRLREIVSFSLLMLAATVISFQLPLVMLLLGWITALDPAILASKRRYAMFGCAVASAILTPADVVSMFLMMVPLYGLFELGLLLMRILPASRIVQATETEDVPDSPQAVEPEPVSTDPDPADVVPPPPGSEPVDPPDIAEGPTPDPDVANPEVEDDRGVWPRPAGDTVARDRGFGIDPAADDLDQEDDTEDEVGKDSS